MAKEPLSPHARTPWKQQEIRTPQDVVRLAAQTSHPTIRELRDMFMVAVDALERDGSPLWEYAHVLGYRYFARNPVRVLAASHTPDFKLSGKPVELPTIKGIANTTAEWATRWPYLRYLNQAATRRKLGHQSLYGISPVRARLTVPLFISTLRSEDSFYSQFKIKVSKGMFLSSLAVSCHRSPPFPSHLFAQMVEDLFAEGRKGVFIDIIEKYPLYLRGEQPLIDEF